MANVETWGVTVEDVLDRLPLARGSVTASSAGLTTGMIERWVRTASGILGALLVRNGIEPDSLGVYERELARDGVASYAESKALAAREYPEEAIRRAWDAWEEVRRTLRTLPQDTGAAHSPRSTVVSSLDVAPTRKSPVPKKFGDGFTGF